VCVNTDRVHRVDLSDRRDIDRKINTDKHSDWLHVEVGYIDIRMLIGRISYYLTTYEKILILNLIAISV